MGKYKNKIFKESELLEAETGGFVNEDEINWDDLFHK